MDMGEGGSSAINHIVHKRSLVIRGVHNGTPWEYKPVGDSNGWVVFVVAMGQIAANGGKRDFGPLAAMDIGKFPHAPRNVN